MHLFAGGAILLLCLGNSVWFVGMQISVRQRNKGIPFIPAEKSELGGSFRQKSHETLCSRGLSQLESGGVPQHSDSATER